MHSALLRPVRFALPLLFAVCGTAAGAPAVVDATIGTGITTSVADVFGDGSNVPIHTRIDRVRYARPARITHGFFRYWELLATVDGVAWGGFGSDPSHPGPASALANYRYSVPVVLRWPDAWDGTLVYFGHGISNPDSLAAADQVLGAANESRYAEKVATWLSDAVVAAPALHAFFAADLYGLGGDGGFSIVALDGPLAGRPLTGAVDVPIARDLAQLAKRLLVRFTGRGVARTIGVGHSAGALVMQFVDGGVASDLETGQRLFTGGNFVEAYNPLSGLIFDGCIPLAGSNVRLHPQFPLTAPMMLVAGEADYSMIDSVLYADRLLRIGVDLNASVRIYQVRNLPHNFAEIVDETPNINRYYLDSFGEAPHDDGDQIRPVVSALVDAMADWLKRGLPPPISRIDGQPVDLDQDSVPDAISFRQAGGASSTMFPLADDPAIDTFVGEQIDTGDPFILSRYAEVLAALSHEGALALPTVTCRVGGYVLGADFGDSTLVPFAPGGNGHGLEIIKHDLCVARSIGQLARQGVYDLRFALDALKPH